MHLNRTIPYDLLADFIDDIGTAHKRIDRTLAEDLRSVAKLIPHLPHALPSEGACPYCRATYLVNHWRPELRGTETVVTHIMRVVERLCPHSEHYNQGYRALWRCENPACGEMELR